MDFNFTIEQNDLDKIFSSIKDKTFLVIGDYCLNINYHLDEDFSKMSNIANILDAISVSSIETELGGAGNVCANLLSLGAKNVIALGVLGEDLYADANQKMLARSGVNTKHLVTQNENWLTNVYTNMHNGDETLPRIDIGTANIMSNTTADSLIANIESNISSAAAIIINAQFTNGIHTKYFQKRLQEVIDNNTDKIFIVDSRFSIYNYKNVILKMSALESCLLLKQNADKVEYNSDKVIEKNIKSIYQKYKNPVFITRGERGMVAYDGGEIQRVYATHITTKVDTLGVKCTSLASIALALSCGIDLQSTIVFANACSAIIAQKVRKMGGATETEVREFIEDMDFVYNFETAQSIRKCPYVKGSEIEVISGSVSKRKIEYAVFDHDGTVSTLRRGWEAIMAPLMVKAILGDSYSKVSEATLRKISEDAQVFIDKTTGIQTIRQMEGLVKLVGDYGYVPKNKILNAKGYKKAYLDELNLLIDERVARLATGQRDIADYTMKGSVEMLKALRERGVTLFLASGTDEEYVKKEAYDLGYGDLFNGGIFGAGDDVKVEPKKIVLDMIIKKIGLDKVNNIVTFGDGPVEIRETVKRGALAVGIASNEEQRFGLNEVKRKRLILAGAHLIIPDFSEYNKLLKALHL